MTDIFRYSPFDAMSQIEVEQYKRLRSNMGKPYELNVVVYDQDKLVGWSVGVQESAETYYMMNSGVMPAYQRKGIYTAMLNYVQREVRKKGFQKIYSRHTMTNNAVLIPKLKAGFVLHRFELCDRFGALVHLCYYTNPIRRRVMDMRSGEAKPDSEVKELFGL